jgi:dTDP-4-dehydrorhamnose reductase
MRILVTGCTGYVGSMIVTHFKQKHEVIGVSKDCEPDSSHFVCDLCNINEVMTVAKQIKPELVIHAAGVKDIVFCEKNGDVAMAINCQATANLAKAFEKTSPIIYLSSDYVFDGERGDYTEQDIPYPVTQYGRTKLAGELEGLRLAPQNFIIIRTAALYDLKANFLKFLLDKLSKGEPIECFSDVIYSPTYYKDFLSVLERIANSPAKPKIYHACGEPVSRYSFAIKVAEIFGFDFKLIKPRSGEVRNLFLFPDLSLNGQKTINELCITVHNHKQALMELAGAIRYENN